MSLSFRAVSRLCYVLRGSYSQHTLYQHFLAHSWTFLSASGQGAKPVQEIHPEGVFVWVFDRSHSWRRADWTFMITTDNILEVVHWWIMLQLILWHVSVSPWYESPRVGLQALYWPVAI